MFCQRATCYLLAFGFLALAFGVPIAISAPGTAIDRAKAFIDRHDAKIRPLEIAASRAWWDANTTGSDADFKLKEEAQNRIDEALADAQAFQELKELHEAVNKKEISDPVVARCINVLYLQYLEKQVDPALLKQITAKSNAIEKAFNAYRAEVDGTKMTDADVRKVLKTSTIGERRQAVWEASKGVGK